MNGSDNNGTEVLVIDLDEVDISAHDTIKRAARKALEGVPAIDAKRSKMYVPRELEDVNITLDNTEEDSFGFEDVEIVEPYELEESLSHLTDVVPPAEPPSEAVQEHDGYQAILDIFKQYWRDSYQEVLDLIEDIEKHNLEEVGRNFGIEDSISDIKNAREEVVRPEYISGRVLESVLKVPVGEGKAVLERRNMNPGFEEGIDWGVFEEHAAHYIQGGRGTNTVVAYSSNFSNEEYETIRKSTEKLIEEF